MNKYLLPFALILLCFSIKAQNPADKNATIYFKDGREKSVIINFDKTKNFSQVTYRASAESKPEIAIASIIDSIISKNDKNNYFSRKIGNEVYLQKKIVGGYADLFYFRDNENKIRFYVTHEDHGDQELTIKTTKTDIGGKTYNRESKQYLGTLALLFKDCPQENLATTKYTIKSLSQIFIDYNNCKNKLSYTAEEIHQKPEVRVALMGGANFTTITTDYETLTGDFGYQSGMDIGMELSLIPAFAASHFSFVLGVNYSDKGGEAEYLRQRFERAVIDYQMIAIDLSVRYNFLPPSAKLNPYIGIFANKSFFLKSQEERMIKVSEDGNSDYLIDIGIPFPNSFPLSFSAEAGVNYLLNDKSGLTLNANLFKYDDGEGYFEAKGYAVQLGYFISL